MNTTIYYFSSTGNSLKAAKDLSEQLESSTIVQISKKNLTSIKDTQSDKIGFIFPVYFYGIPVIVKNFIEKLHINKDTYVFAVATYGRMAGISHKQIEKLLNKKDVNLSASFGIQMPGSYQVMYPPFSEEQQNKLFKNERGQINEIASFIKSKKIVKQKSNFLMDTIGGLLSATFRPQNKDKNFWTDEKCNGCGTCLKICPANNIVIAKGKPKWQHQCENCLACMQWCPQNSIQYKKSTVKRGRYHHPDIKSNELIQK